MPAPRFDRLAAVLNTLTEQPSRSNSFWITFRFTGLSSAARTSMPGAPGQAGTVCRSGSATGLPSSATTEMRSVAAASQPALDPEPLPSGSWNDAVNEKVLPTPGSLPRGAAHPLVGRVARISRGRAPCRRTAAWSTCQPARNSRKSWLVSRSGCPPRYRARTPIRRFRPFSRAAAATFSTILHARKLDRIAYQVIDHLCETYRIAENPLRNVWCKLADDLQLFGTGQDIQHPHRRADTVRRLNATLSSWSLPASILEKSRMSSITATRTSAEDRAAAR